MIKLTMTPRGAKKSTVYESTGVRMRETLEAYDLLKAWEDANGDFDPEYIDRCLDFICRCFDGRFTKDELLDGYEGSVFVLIPQILQEVLSYVAQRITAFPHPEATVQATRG